MRPNLATLIRVAFTGFYLLGTAASIYSALVVGPQPSWARRVAFGVTVAVILLGALLLRFLWPVLRDNPRQVSLVTAIRRVGMIDVESRNEGDRHLPPEAIYMLPGLRELVISGISAASSFRNHMGLIRHLLEDKADIYFLVCSERTEGLNRISEIERRNVVAEIQEVRDVIVKERLLSDEHFHIRVFSHLPTFTAVMIDGDIVPRQKLPQDSKGVVRVQPRRMESTHHEGIVLEFENTGNVLDGFSLFAADLREQWRVAGPWT